mmetsp:Transcript_43479/g.69571  ORF Transcript_43479/g.69571 Transcript_43479/m.69571 type:complete len:83 (-) Transcript_43479:3346-3594(-)
MVMYSEIRSSSCWENSSPIGPMDATPGRAEDDALDVGERCPPCGVVDLCIRKQQYGVVSLFAACFSTLGGGSLSPEAQFALV